MTSGMRPIHMGGARRARHRWVAWAILVPVLVVASVLIWWQADTTRILEDTLQHIGVARNVLRGLGLQTTLLYYDAQYAPQVLPAPQTVWPPGMPLGIAAFSLLGLEPGTAALFIGWLSFAAAAGLLAWILVRAAIAPPIAGLVTAIWAMSSANWMSAAIAASELPYVACLLAATAACVAGLEREHVRLRPMLLAGLAAACAVSVRYMGVVFVVSAGFVILGALHLKWRERLAASLAFGAIPAALTVTLAVRNFVATGHLSGGQFGLTGRLDALDAVQHAWWSTVELFALPRDGMAATVMQVALLGLLGFTVLLVIWRFAVRRPPALHEGGGKAQRVLLALGIIYCGGTVILHLVWAMRVHEGMLDSRYFEPLLPFACVIFAIATNDVYARLEAGRRFLVAALAALCLGYSLVQWQHWGGSWAGYSSVANDRAVSRALSTPFAGQTAGGWLASSDAVGPIVATLEHALHAKLHHPVLGLPDSRYTVKIWDGEAVRALMKGYGACIVFFVPDRFAVARAGNLPFFRALAAGQPPPWLEPVLISADVELYRLTDDDRCTGLLP